MPDGDESGENDDDSMLWGRVAKDVRPLAGKGGKKNPSAAAGKRPVSPTVPRRRHVPPAPEMKETEKQQLNPGIDRRTDERLRRGLREVEARVDLHGLTQAEALDRLRSFLTAAYGDGTRCVLVITGKGGKRPGEPGILKSRLPEWLAAPPLADMVLRCYPAKAKDGGAGAFYVLLRRHRR